MEEYFRAEAVAVGGTGCDEWCKLENRLSPCVDRILRILDDYQTSATFFILGWVAENERDVVRKIADAGHEIASHGMTHAMLHRLSPDKFRGELIDSRKLLEDIAGQPVIGYRAPTFSVTNRTAWAIDVLAETGYRYDSSVFPIRHDRYGVPDAPRFSHIAKGPGGGEILEIPPLTMRLMGMNFPVGGGGYFRLLPVGLFTRALKNAQRAGRIGMIYLHPWELDPDQPILPMGKISRWRHRVNLAKTKQKLRYLLSKTNFTTAAEYLNSNPDITRTHEYNLTNAQ